LQLVAIAHSIWPTDTLIDRQIFWLSVLYDWSGCNKI